MIAIEGGYGGSVGVGGSVVKHVIVEEIANNLYTARSKGPIGKH
jgi:hypothetical protein